MMSEAKKPHPIPQQQARKTPTAGLASRYPFVVTVGSRSGEELEGLEAHPDGVSFRSPRPILGGEVIQLILHQTILVDAQVVGCAPLSTREGGYWVRARFHETSQELNGLIYKELFRLIEEAAAVDAKAALSDASEAEAEARQPIAAEA